MVGTSFSFLFLSSPLSGSEIALFFWRGYPRENKFSGKRDATVGGIAKLHVLGVSSWDRWEDVGHGFIC